jgi:hypothetical protein
MVNFQILAAGVSLTTLAAFTALVLVSVDISGHYKHADDAIPDVRGLASDADFYFHFDPSTGSSWQPVSALTASLFSTLHNSSVSVRNSSGQIEFISNGISVGSWSDHGGLQVKPHGIGADQSATVSLFELSEYGQNFVALRAPSNLSTSTIFTLPDGDGDSGNVLGTNGAGELMWAFLPGAHQISSADGTSSVTVNGTTDTIQFKSAGALVGDWDATSGLNVRPHGTASGQSGTVSLFELEANGNNKVSLRAPDNLVADTTMTLPATSGQDGYVWTTDGTGTTRWAAPALANRSTVVWAPVLAKDNNNVLEPITTYSQAYDSRGSCVSTLVSDGGYETVEFSCWIINQNAVAPAQDSPILIPVPLGAHAPRDDVALMDDTGGHIPGSWSSFQSGSGFAWVTRGELGYRKVPATTGDLFFVLFTTKEFQFAFTNVNATYMLDQLSYIQISGSYPAISNT